MEVSVELKIILKRETIKPQNKNNNNDNKTF